MNAIQQLLISVLKRFERHHVVVTAATMARGQESKGLAYYFVVVVDVFVDIIQIELVHVVGVRVFLDRFNCAGMQFIYFLLSVT